MSVLPHERTAAQGEVRPAWRCCGATRANLDPIWGLSLAGGLTEQLEPEIALARGVDGDGVIHALGAIDDPARIAADPRRAMIGSAELVLADGHHRFETACTYRDELRAAGEEVGGAGAIMMFVVELVDDELDIEPIHRLLDLPAGIDLRDRLRDAFEVVDAGPASADGVAALQARMLAEHGLGLVDRAGLFLYVWRSRRNRRRAGPRARRRAPPRCCRRPTPRPWSRRSWRPAGSREATWRHWHDAAAVAALVDKGEEEAGDPAAARSGRSFLRSRALRPRDRRACRRRRRSSRPSPARAWCSAASKVSARREPGLAS